MSATLDPPDDPLAQAWQVQTDAAERGFDWPDVSGVLEKVHEEVNEIAAACRSGDLEHAKRELGDLLFSAVNVARFLHARPREELLRATERFQSRFDQVKYQLACAGRSVSQCSLEELDLLWERVKKG